MPKSLTQVPVMVKEGIADVDAGSRYGVAVATTVTCFSGELTLPALSCLTPLMSLNFSTPTVKGNGYTAVTAGLTTVYGFKQQTAYVWGGNSNGEAGIGSTEGALLSLTKWNAKFSQ